MSVYFVKNKGWRYDFTLKGLRYTDQWYETKKEASRAEALRREEVLKPPIPIEILDVSQTDITFFDLVTRRLDHISAYNSQKHYTDCRYLAKIWVKHWGKLDCKSIHQDMIEEYILKRGRDVSNFTANKEIRYLRATFNFGIKKKLIKNNPVNGIDFLPIEKRIKYVPPPEDVEKVLNMADQDTRDYLVLFRDSLGRMSEINRLEWKDVDFKSQSIILYTRKKRGGDLTPRRIPMTKDLCAVLLKRYRDRDKSKPWVFWHKYTSSKTGEKMVGPYTDRKKIMRTLCDKAGVRYFRYHAIRHSGASLMDNNNVPTGSIQRILGHENRSTTEIYLHSLGDSEREAIKVFEKARQNSHTDSHTE